MGDHREQLVALDVDEAAAADVRSRLHDWLVAQGWVVGPARPDWLHPHEPAYVFVDPVEPTGASSDGVGSLCVASTDPCWHGGDGTFGPACPRCDAPGDLAPVGDWLETWVEPVLRCDRCGFEARYGDWDNTASVVAGRVAVVLDLGPDDPDAFVGHLVEALRGGFGGRWTHVHLHG